MGNLRRLDEASRAIQRTSASATVPYQGGGADHLIGASKWVQGDSGRLGLAVASAGVAVHRLDPRQSLSPARSRFDVQHE